MAETMAKEIKKIEILTDRCKGCQLCINACPKGLIKLSSTLNKRGVYPAQYRDEKNQCTACAFCATVCPDVCIEVSKTSKTD